MDRMDGGHLKTLESLVRDFLGNDMAKMRNAEQQLLQLREAAVSSLVARLGESDPSDNRIGKLLRVIGDFGRVALRQLISNGSHHERCGALRALWEFEVDAATEVPLLLGFLDAEDSEIRRRAAHCLGRIAIVPRGAAERLVQLAYDVDPKVQFSALFALSQIGYDTKILAEICFDILESADWERVQGALLTLKRIAENPSKAARRLLELLSSSESTVSCLPLLDLLAACEVFSEAESKMLEDFIRRSERRMVERARAVQVWWKHTANSGRVSSLLLELLSVREDFESICDAVAFIGPDAAPLVPRLIELLQHDSKNWDVCWSAVDALGSIGPAAAAAVPILNSFQGHESPLLRARVQDALNRIQGAPASEG